MKVTIYGKENCSFCRRSVSLCKRKEIDYNYISLVKEISNPEKEVTKEQLERLLNMKVETVPQIIVEVDGKEKYIGEYETFNKYIRDLQR